MSVLVATAAALLPAAAVAAPPAPAAAAALPAPAAAAAQPARPFGWPFSWERLPTAMFGCNTSGLESSSQMEFNARFGITIYEARTMEDLHGYTNTEHWLQVQAAAMKRAHNVEPVFVYRSASGTDAFFKLGAEIIDNATRREQWLLHYQPNPKTGKLNCDPHGFGCSDYDFRVPAMREYYLNQIIPEVTAEPNIDGVFFDDCDTVIGGARSGAWLSERERAELSNASLPVLAAAFRQLNAAGKTPMWSTGRTFSGIPAAGVRVHDIVPYTLIQ